jgi:hypothetical protein
MNFIHFAPGGSCCHRSGPSRLTFDFQVTYTISWELCFAWTERRPCPKETMQCNATECFLPVTLLKRSSFERFHTNGKYDGPAKGKTVDEHNGKSRSCHADPLVERFYARRTILKIQTEECLWRKN